MKKIREKIDVFNAHKYMKKITVFSLADFQVFINIKLLLVKLIKKLNIFTGHEKTRKKEI